MRPWGPWRPDAMGPQGFCTIADGVLPGTMGDGGGGQIISYGPFPSLVQATGAEALSGECRGAVWLVKFDGTYELYFATATTIEKMSGGFTLSDVETGRTITSGDDVSFLPFGAYLLNSDTTSGFKAYNFETPGTNDAVADAPAARFLFSCNNSIFALDCDGNNRRMESTAPGDHTNWTTQGADGKTFEDGGALICGCDLKNGQGLIWQERAMRLIQFGGAGSVALYSIVKLADGRGSVGQRSMVSFDGMAFYLASDGFYKYDGTNGNQAIGAEKVNRWFLSQVDSARLGEVQAAIDPLNKIVLWRFPSTSNSSTSVFDRVIGYDWQLNEWFTLTVDTCWLARFATPGYTLEDMDAFGTLDGMPQIPLDDRFWRGGEPKLIALDSSLKYATFSGTAMAMTVQASPVMQDQRALVNEATSISDDADVAMTIGVQERLSDAVTWKGPYAPSTRSGRTKTRASGRLLTFKSTHAAGATWTYDNGVDYAKQAMMGE